MNAAQIKPFLVATQRVFEKMLECPCRIGKPTVSRGLNDSVEFAQAIVAVSGSYEGLMVLSMPAEVTDAAGALLGISASVGGNARHADTRHTEAAMLVARLIKTTLRRSVGTEQMRFKAIADSDPQFSGSPFRQQGAWLMVPMIGRFGKFSFSLSLKPVATATASL